MEIINVIIAGIAAFAFGAVWYMSLSKPWMAATGTTEEETNNTGNAPYIIAMVGAILTAGMMRHIFAGTGVDGVGSGVLSGFGIGLFIAAPWIINNCAFAGRPASLMLIDGGYAVGGCTVIGLVLTLF
jgi:hypothetical protein